MKKLALFLALCLLLQAVGLAAFADEPAVEIPEAPQVEAGTPEEAPEEEAPAKEEEPAKEEAPAKEEEPAKEEAPAKEEEPAKEEAPAKEEESEKEDEAPVKEEESEKEDEAPAVEEESEKEDEVPAVEEESEKEDEAPAKEEESEKEDEAPVKEEASEKEDEAPAKEEKPAKDKEAEEEEEPAEEEQVVHFTEGYILIKAGTKVCASTKLANVLGTITSNSYAYARMEQQSETDPAKDWLKIFFDTAEGEEVKAFIQVKYISTLSDEEQTALQARLGRLNAREMGGKPVPVAEFKASETVKAEEEEAEPAQAEEAAEPAQEEAAEPAQEEAAEPAQEEETEPAQDEEAEEPAQGEEAEEPAQEEETEPAQDAEAAAEPEKVEESKGLVEDNGDAKNFVLDDQDYICEYNGDWTALTLPDTVDGKTVQGITQAAFSGNTIIKSIVIPAGAYSDIEDGAFENCTALESVTFFNPVTTIVAKAFQGCTSLRSVAWPAGLTTIEHDAFHGCTALSAIAMTANVTEIGNNAFQGCTALADLDLEGATSLTTIGSEAFKGCSSLRAIILPASVTTIRNSAFEGCSAATKLTLPAGLTRIENFTFKNCSSLKTASIPASVTYIGQEAFYNCSSLDWVIIRQNVVNILKNAFYGISANTVVYAYQSTNVQISENGLGTTGIVVGQIDKDVHKYVKQSGQKFVSKEGMDYIVRCYKYLLARSCTIAERTPYVRALGQGKKTGASITKSFMNSEECKSKKWTNTEKVNKVYRVMLARSSDPSASETKGYRQALNARMSTDWLINSVAGSDEHTNKCKTWLMTPGSLTLTRYRDKNKNVTLFVRNAYQYVYHDGNASKVTTTQVENGCKKLLGDKASAYTFLHSLFDSATFKNKNTNNTTYVTRLYQAYQMRTPSSSEINGWVNNLTVKKQSRATVEKGFANSKEFTDKMKKLGLKAK